MKRQAYITSIQNLWALFCVKYTKSNSTILKSPVSLARAYVNNMMTHVKHNGKAWTCQRFKLLHIAAIRIATADHSPHNIPFCRTSKAGVPMDLVPLLPLLQSSHKDLIRIGLTITRCYELIILPPVLDLEAITLEGPRLDTPLLAKFKQFCNVWTANLHIQNAKTITKRDTVIGNLVKGPNGPAILTAHYDAVAVINDSALSSALDSLAASFGNSWIMDLARNIAANTPYGNFIHSRIAMLSQGGGKTRIIAIGDYWSQNILRPLHDFVMEVLRRLETDGTWNQQSQVERILRESMGHAAYSFDLSSATDRFPIVLQEILLSFIVGEETAGYWKKVMINRGFQTPTKSTVRWEVGQPLGMLSSWAMFSLTHHCLIEFCAWLEGIKSFRQYAVLGDDVVIWNRVVAQRYQTTLEQIGVKINLNKSLVGNACTQRVEFAKRILFDGNEITGLKPNILVQARYSIYMLIDLVQVAQFRNWDLPWHVFWAPSPPDKARELLALLAWERAATEVQRLADKDKSLTASGAASSLTLDFPSMPPVLRGYTSSEVSIQELWRKVLELRIDALRVKRDSVDKILTGNKPISDLFQREGVVYTPKLIENYAFPHPIVWALNQTGEELFLALSELESVLDNGTASNPDVLPVEYLPIPDHATYFGDRHSLKSTVRSTFVVKAWFLLRNADSKKPTQ